MNSKGAILGLDIGSNSIGWALVNPADQQITAAGVRVFPEGVERDTKGSEISRNAARRQARSARRTRFRRNCRKDKLSRMLRRNGLFPETQPEVDQLFIEEDPYSLRARALDEKIDLYQLGRVFYHLSQRRGYKSNRKTGQDKEDGIVIKSASQLQKEIEEKNCRTLGEYFAKIDPHEQRIRDRYTFRSMYEDEFNLIWKTQKQFYPDILTDILYEKMKDRTIFYQRPVRWDRETIGSCSLEPDQKRCPRADWYAIRFRIWQDINNLFIIDELGQEKPLNKNQKAFLFEELNKKKKVNYTDLRKKFELPETATFNFEQNNGRSSFTGNEFYDQLRSPKVLGKKMFNSLSEPDLVQINEILLDETVSDDEFIDFLTQQHGLSQQQAQAVLSISLPSGHMRYSRLAIQKLLNHLEDGLPTHKAVKKAYGEYQPGRPERQYDQLPVPEPLNNPIVSRGLFEVRKVVNNVIRRYGTPETIQVEMARDVKGSRREREEIQKKMKENEKRNQKARTVLITEFNIPNPSRNDIIKYKLWEECGHICPYTGKPIAQQALFGPHPDFQIEHIIPYSRCLDDSYMNKTLCYVEENRRKGEKTPYEYYGQAEQWETLLQRIRTLPYPKRRKFVQKEVKLDEFIERQLNDTRYITRLVVGYLKQIKGVKVRGTKGKVTSDLRREWGLNNILDHTGVGLKNREDHRHHAVDAIVTALTDNSHLRQLAFSKYAHDEKFELPWPDMWDQAHRVVNAINVSHRVQRKVSGSLHEDTNYGPTNQKDTNGQTYYVYRKKLEDLSMPMTHKIVDPVVRAIVHDRLLKFGLDPEKNQKIPKEVWTDPLYMKTKNGSRGPQIKKVRIRDVFNNMVLFKDKNGRVTKAAKSGSNHHIEIVEYADKKEQKKCEGVVVPMLAAVRRSHKKQPVINRDHGPDKKFLFSLAKNEMYMLEDEDGEHVLHRVQYITLLPGGPRIVLRPHNYAGDCKESDPKPLIQRKTPNSLKGFKVSVDPIGGVCRAND